MRRRVQVSLSASPDRPTVRRRQVGDSAVMASVHWLRWDEAEHLGSRVTLVGRPDGTWAVFAFPADGPSVQVVSGAFVGDSVTVDAPPVQDDGRHLSAETMAERITAAGLGVGALLRLSTADRDRVLGVGAWCGVEDVNLCTALRMIALREVTP